MKRTTVRFSQSTLEKLSWLTERYGTQTKVLVVAIDRLYRQERLEWENRQREHKNGVLDDKV